MEKPYVVNGIGCDTFEEALNVLRDVRTELKKPAIEEQLLAVKNKANDPVAARRALGIADYEE